MDQARTKKNIENPLVKIKEKEEGGQGRIEINKLHKQKRKKKKSDGWTNEQSSQVHSTWKERAYIL